MIDVLAEARSFLMMLRMKLVLSTGASASLAARCCCRRDVAAVVGALCCRPQRRGSAARHTDARRRRRPEGQREQREVQLGRARGARMSGRKRSFIWIERRDTRDADVARRQLRTSAPLRTLRGGRDERRAARAARRRRLNKPHPPSSRTESRRSSSRRLRWRTARLPQPELWPTTSRATRARFSALGFTMVLIGAWQLWLPPQAIWKVK